MENFCENLTRKVVNFKLGRCCFLAPIRMGILIIGYFNIFVSVILIIGTATDSFMPTIKHIQDKIMEEGSKSTCILVPTTELGFSVLLLCGMHRNDVVLLRFYMLYAIAATFVSLLVYSLVIAIVDILYIIVIVASILYQVYIVILVRSAIVDIKLRNATENNGNFNHKPSEIHAKNVADVETPELLKEPEVVAIELTKTEDKKGEDQKLDDRKSHDKKIVEDNKIDGKRSESKNIDSIKINDKKVEVKTKVETVNEKLEKTETPNVTVKSSNA